MNMGAGYYRGMEETYSKRIDELMAENKRLREALEKIANMHCPDLDDDMIARTAQLGGIWAACLMIAKEALAPREDKHG